MNMLLNAGPGLKRSLDRRIEIMTAGAAPPAAVIEGMEGLGFHITHVYGLTEVYGPAVVCAWHDEWDELPAAERARLKARQGVTYPVLVRPARNETVIPQGRHCECSEAISG
jgi:fatty-acyl-CoA synthase